MKTLSDEERVNQIWVQVLDVYATSSDLKEGEATEAMLMRQTGLSRGKIRARIEKMIKDGVITKRENAFHNGKSCVAYSVVETKQQERAAAASGAKSVHTS